MAKKGNENPCKLLILVIYILTVVYGKQAHKI